MAEDTIKDTDAAIGQEMERARTAIARIEDLSYADLLNRLARDAERPDAPSAPPLPSTITDAQSKALARLKAVYGKVQPTERRSISPAEIEAVMDERLVLDEVKKMAAKRIEAQRTILFNHLDVEAEEAKEVKDDTYRDSQGHWVLAGRAVSAKTGKAFTREPRAGSVSVNPDDLAALAKDEPAKAKIREALGDPGWDFTHEDYLAVTRPVRILDEEKAMIAMRKKPGLVAAYAHVTQTGAPSGAFNIRPAKAK